MKRREFLDTCAVGLTVGAGATGESKTARAAAQRDADWAKLKEAARQHFLEGKRSCSESILLAGCHALGIESKLIPDIALGLAGGIGLQGDTCGALTGSALVISLAVAEKETQDPAKKKARTLQAAGRVHRQFKQRFGDARCRALCGLDLTTPEGMKELMKGVKEQKCAQFVEAAAELVASELESL
jgi:C_GCAxxG_C_C family probable redox protein